MPSLPEVTERFEANVVEFLAGLQDIIDKCAEVVNAIHEVSDAALTMAGAVDAAAGSAGRALDGLTSKAGLTAAALGKVASQAGDIRTAMAGAAAASTAAAATMAAAAAATDAKAATSAGIVATWWGRWGQALHWIVMGTLEIAATAIPALIAFGAAAAGMYPTFVHIYDQMNNLVTASGSVRGALLNSVGPLHNLGVNFGVVSRAMAPDAYVIFGSVINSLSGHFGAFAQVAQQAGNVLAAFATKLSAELSGPLGGQLAGFFQNAVKYMVQWGQFLGNLGHAFLNMASDMRGVGQLLLDVLVKISQGFLAITSNPVAGWFIGVGFAMSAAYRYGKLLVTIFNWLGGSALVTGIRNMIPALAAWASALFSIRTAADAAAFGQLALEAAMGPLGIAIAAIGVGLGIWYLATRHTADATDNLIKQVEGMPPTVQNLTGGIGKLEGNLNSLAATQVRQGKAMTDVAGQYAKYNTAVVEAGIHHVTTAADVSKNIDAIRHEAQELINLDTGLAEAGTRTGALGAAMNAQAIQTAIADSKVTAFNQAIDAYIGLLTGGTSAQASFTQAMSNLTTGTNRITTILGSSGSATLSVKQFAQALTQMNATGSAAWQNFNNVLTGSMGPLLDWFRQAGVVGAASGRDVTRAALDMAKSLVPLAANSKTAQAELLGILRAQGLNIKDFPALQKMVSGTGIGMHDLTKLTDGTTQALSNLSQMAKNAATALNTQVSQAIAQNALAASGFNTDLLKLQHDMQNRAPANVIHADLTKVNSDLATAQANAIKTGNQINSGMNTASAAMDRARAHARLLQMMFDAMHGFNITNTVNTNYNQVYRSYGQPSRPGQTGVGASGGFVHGPGTSTSDTAGLFALSHGEYVMNAASVEHYGRAAMDAMNARRLAGGGPAITPGRPSPAVSAAALGGGGSGQLTLNLRIDSYLDSQKVGSRQRQETLEYVRRNPGNNLDLRVR